MEKITQLEWIKSFAQTPGEKIFIERWLELFNKFTIDSYRVRFHNSHTILSELVKLIDTALAKQIPLRHLKWVAREATDIIKKDPSFKNLSPKFSILFEELNRSSNWNNDTPISNIRYFLNNILIDLSKHYYILLFDNLKEAIYNNNYDDIYSLTSYIGSEFIFNEYSQQYLYTIRNLFFNPSISDFKSFFDKYQIYITKPSEFYKVIISFQASNVKDIPSNISDVNISKNITLQSYDNDVLNYLKGGDYKWYSEINIEAKDQYMAAILAEQKFEDAIDVLSYGFPINNYIINSSAIVYIPTINKSKIINTKQLIPGFFRSDKDWFDNINSSITNICNNYQIIQTTKDKLKSSLRYIRQGRAAVTAEEQFLNYWIAFEFLIRMEGYRNIIDPITEFSPKILSIYYPRKILRDFIENINRLDISYNDRIRKALDIDKNFDKKEARLIFIIRDSAMKNDLLSACSSSTLLTYRLNMIINDFDSSSKIYSFIKNHEQNIKWQLARIYRLRNRIVHGAEYNLIIGQLSANLLSYLHDILNEIIYQLSISKYLKSINDFILAYGYSYDNWMEELKRDKNNRMSLDDIIDPVKTLISN